MTHTTRRLSKTRFAAVTTVLLAAAPFLWTLAGCRSDAPPTVPPLAASSVTPSAANSSAPPPVTEHSETSPVGEAPAPAATPDRAATVATPVPSAAKTTPAGPVRALYMSGWVAGGTTRWKQLLDIVDKTELNAVVIDVKEDGMLSYAAPNVALAVEVGANQKMIPDVDAKLAELKKRKIYAIARITVFRDKIAARKKPALAVQRPDGSPWRDRSGHFWLDPYNQQNWDYNVAVAQDAARRGFDEVQWDYVRFPSEGARSGRRYPAKAKTDARSEARVIADFLAYAKEKLGPSGVKVSADVFGLALSADDGLGIGQKLALMVPHLDVVCPMVYPSHYGRGSLGVSHPNAAPYQTVLRALRDGNKRLKAIPNHACTMRPWLQDFSLGVRYGEKQVRAQIQAARANGVKEYLLWNASNRYTTAALVPPKPKKSRQARQRSSRTAKATTRAEKQPPAATRPVRR